MNPPVPQPLPERPGPRRAGPLRLPRLLAAAALAGLAACAPSAPRPPRNVVLISIDTLRAEMLGCYGYDRPVSPAIDALAREGVLFEDVMAPSPWTLPSHGSLLTGLYPDRHGLKDYDRELPGDLVTAAEVLAAHGLATAAVVNSPNVGRRYGLDRGFEDFTYLPRDSEARAPSGVEEHALRWLDEHADERFFLFLHFYDVHSAYASLPEYESRFERPTPTGLGGSSPELLELRARGQGLRPGQVTRLVDLYVAGIRQLDDDVARVLARLDELGIADETLVVLTSDHGEEFGEHGGVLHGRTQYQEVLHVPLVLRGPGLPAGARVPTPVSLVDVLPTVLGTLGVAPPPGLDGVDLAPLWRSAPEEELAQRLLYSGADHNRETGHDQTRAVRYREFKLVLDRHTGEARLFDLRADPSETTDASEAHPEVARMLRLRLDAYLSREEQRGGELPPLTEEEVAELEALGYL